MIVGVDRSASKLIERYAVVTIRDNVIEGLPARATPALRVLIAAKAHEAATTFNSSAGQSASVSPVFAEPAKPEPEQTVYDALYDHNDVLIDGDTHADAIDRVIRSATERLIIHSTFITESRAQALLPLLLHAAGKGTKVDILWGQDDAGGKSTSSKAAAAKLQAWISDTGRTDLLTVHQFSTNSHAKVVVADNGRGAWRALLGSCNWLASDFQSFETSMNLRDPAIIGLIMRKLAGLSRGRPGLWNDLAIEMTVLGRRIESLPRGSGRTVPMRPLFGADHAKVVLDARDKAQKRIFALSHRLGIAGQPMALLPMLSAAQANDIHASIFYGQTTGPLSGMDGAALTREFAGKGVQIRPVRRPRLHAKVLGWDDDVLAITSLNWLSADAAEGVPYREIGILVEAPKIADNFIRRFELARAE